MNPIEKEEKPTVFRQAQEEALSGPGQITHEVALSNDGFKLFPQPVTGDVLDPLNWSFVQKHAILAIVMALYFMFTYITTTTVPSFSELEQQYAATLEQVNWTVAIPALGLSVGPLIWSSPADIIGRRPIFLLGTTMALISSIGAAVAPTYPAYMAARFFQGLGVSPASNVGMAIINDIFFEHQRGQKIGLWVLAIDLGLLFGPLVGGFVTLAGHVWVQWLSAILFGGILLAELMFLPETLYPRDFMMSTTKGNGIAALSASEKATATQATRERSYVQRTKGLPFVHITPLPGIKHPKPYDTLVQFFKTFKHIVVPISVMSYCFGWYWWVLSVITLIPTAYDTYSPQSQGLLFVGLIIGTLFSEVFCSGRLSDKLMVRLAKRNDGLKAPEMRLWLAYPAAILTAVGMILWGISVDKSYHWIIGQIAFTLFGAGIQMGNTAVCSYISDAYPLQNMAVMTFYAVMLNLSAFIDPFFIVPWVENVGFTWTFTGHAMVTVFFCIPIIVLLHRFGRNMRERSGGFI